MTRVAILPVPTPQGQISYHAVAGTKQSSGRTPGAALDAWTAEFPSDETTTFVIVQSLSPDRFFSAAQQQRLDQLMTEWRLARDQGQALPPEEQAELESLVEAELRAATARASGLADDLSL